MDLYTFDFHCGHSEARLLDKFENGRMVTYGYSVDYDQNGAEISRTDPYKLGSIGWSDGSAFTEEDYSITQPNTR